LVHQKKFGNGSDQIPRAEKDSQSEELFSLYFAIKILLFFIEYSR
jgi:hypothetical protein